VRATSRHAALLTALAAAAALAGCGSSASPSANASARAAFIAQADAICNEADGRIVKLQPPAANGELSSAARLLGQELPIATAELSSMRRLTPPAAERGPFAQYLLVSAQEIAAAGHLRELAAANDVAGFHEAAAQLAALSPKSNAAAVAAGLGVCLKAPEPHGRG